MRSDLIVKLLRAGMQAEDLHGYECGWKYYDTAFDKGPTYTVKPGLVASKGNSSELTLNSASLGQIKVEYDCEGEVAFWFPTSLLDQVKQSVLRCLTNSERHTGRDWAKVWEEAQEGGFGLLEDGMTLIPWDAWSFSQWLIEQIEAGATFGEHGFCTNEHAEWILASDPREYELPWA